MVYRRDEGLDRLELRVLGLLRVLGGIGVLGQGAFGCRPFERNRRNMGHCSQ